MRYDVETDQCGDAFDDCLWDETIEALWHMDQIEQSYNYEVASGHLHQGDVVRHIEGGTLWTLLTMNADFNQQCNNSWHETILGDVPYEPSEATPDDGQPGSIEWNGSPFQQGHLGSLCEEDLSLLVESMDSDCTHAYEILLRSMPNLPEELTFRSYGYYDGYQGVRALQISVGRLHHWQLLVKELWSDHEPADTTILHVVVPQPIESSFEFHVIARTSNSLDGHHFLLVDKIEESPQPSLTRKVIETSQNPNGYEILLASEMNINVVTSRTILKLGNVIWPHYRRPPVQDGQYWRILVEDEYDETSMIQLTSTSCSTRSDLDLSHEGFFQHPHVFDRWCDGGRHLLADEDTDLNHLMQLPSQEVLYTSGDSDVAIPNTAWEDFCEVCFLSPEEGSWTLMTYGLLDSHIGTRSVEIDDMTPTNVKAALRAAWDDVPHSARIYAVRPNPDDGPFAHIIIEFEATHPHDEREVPVLRRIFRGSHAHVEAAYHHAARHAFDIFYQAGLSSICAPWANQECRLYLNNIQLRDNLPFTLRPGSLLDIHIDLLIQQERQEVNDPLGIDDEDEVGLMQSPLPSQSEGPITHDFFHLENEHFHIDIAPDDVSNIETIVENDRQLPTIGPSSIRGFHWVANPPRIGNGLSQVYILELRGDAESRLMNDDVLCLCQLTIEQPRPGGDVSTRIRVLWTPHIASRERIMFHLRAADLCREMTCLLYVNHIAWNEQDSILRHFRDGDFIHLKVVVEQGASVAATRCDFQSYTERQRRVFTNASSSSGTENSNDSLSLG